MPSPSSYMNIFTSALAKKSSFALPLQCGGTCRGNSHHVLLKRFPCVCVLSHAKVCLDLLEVLRQAVFPWPAKRDPSSMGRISNKGEQIWQIAIERGRNWPPSGLYWTMSVVDDLIQSCLAAICSSKRKKNSTQRLHSPSTGHIEGVRLAYWLRQTICHRWWYCRSHRLLVSPLDLDMLPFPLWSTTSRSHISAWSHLQFCQVQRREEMSCRGRRGQW